MRKTDASDVPKEGALVPELAPRMLLTTLRARELTVIASSHSNLTSRLRNGEDFVRVLGNERRERALRYSRRLRSPLGK
jgi:hypothetical protein